MKNYINVIGNVTKEVAFVEDKQIATFTVAVNNTQGVNYFDCVAYGNTAQRVKGCVKKGACINVDAALKVSRYKKDNERYDREKITLEVRDFDLINGGRFSRNYVHLIGRITKVPVVEKTTTGLRSICSVNLAVNIYNNKENKEVPMYFKCILWDEQAEKFSQKAHKGSLVDLDGYLKFREYQNPEEQYKRIVHEVNVTSFRIAYGVNHAVEDTIVPDDAFAPEEINLDEINLDELDAMDI